MTTVGVVFLVVIPLAVFVCIAGRYLSRWNLQRGRQPMPVAEIVSGLPQTVGRDEASEILQVIGKSFRLKPEILRLDDPISALTAIDSCVLGEGQEEFERWLESKGVRSFQQKPSTIRELIVSVLPFDAHRQGIAR